MAINVGEGMTDEVGRQRGGWKSRARSSTRRERVTEVAIPRGGKGKEVAGSTSEAQDEPESQHEVVAEAQDVDEVNAEIEAEEKDEQPPPSPQKKNPRTTRRRNPPQVAPPPVTGYGGGPSDLSLLPSFGKHVAASLWRGECVGRYLKCMNNGKKVNDFDKPDSNLRWFWNVVDASGLRPLLKTNYNHVDWGLLTAFTKRWHPETGTFYLPISEMTITLDDVSCLLHIPINGKMLNHVGTACSMAEGKDMCEKYLNFNRDDCKQEFSKMKGAHIGFPKLEKIYHANLSQALEAENNQESDDETSVKLTRGIGVLLDSHICLTTWMLQVARNVEITACIMVHFKRFGMRFLVDDYTHQEPVAAKFVPLKGAKFPDEHRTVLDRMEVDEVTFCPYENHRHTRPFVDISWYSGWIMCGNAMICPHFPERILRQYGHVQSIPRAPDVSAKAGMNRFSIDQGFREYLTHNYVTEEMHGPRAQNGFDTDPEYIAWFYQVSHPKLWPPIQGNPPRPSNVLIVEDNANEKCDVFEICSAIRTEVREKLDSDLTLEEARKLLEKVYGDLEPVTTYSVRRKRKRHSGEGKKKRKKKRSGEAGLSH
ncbi:uncharacterized protein LOC123895346 isoform X2 [Trifolium pratense]|uniref:uncharacterized protein LOC123895346 isoform X2 n=1 Tax=Trifolium pratense TaxID=57577 RepID=UPI001E696920|nr:uncharacterized protein LOC123895346 isoform X2 [Trifolium pratense]